jgi:hypothetical protein
MKLKNVHTGEVRDVVSLTYVDGSVTGLWFSGTQWEKLLVQRWDFVMASAETFWVPAKPGLDY